MTFRSRDAIGRGVAGEIALAGTSMFIAVELDRPISSRPPERLSVSVVTVGGIRPGPSQHTTVRAEHDGSRRYRQSQPSTPYRSTKER
jgi:hypothetical protein